MPSWKTVHPSPAGRAVKTAPLLEAVNTAGADLLDRRRPAVVARAPGRLDCMGGIADYCGSVVFESPLAQATWVVLQPRTDAVLRVRTTGLGAAAPVDWQGRLDLFRQGARLKTYAQVRRLFTGDHTWAGYVAGAYYVLQKERACPRLTHGADILVCSDVPVGEGVASSAALEVAAMTAVVKAEAIAIDGLELARLCQIVENRVVGAPCGIMDQVTAALGRADALLALRCQPHDVLGTTRLPDGVTLFGLSTRVKHSVGGSQYTNARIGAFMGHKVILTRMGARPGRRDPLGGYLCNLDPATYRREFRRWIPARIGGDAFLRRYGPTVDRATRVDPGTEYQPRPCTEHPIYENRRVQQFIDLVGRVDLRRGDRELIAAGKLMFGSHWSYGHNCRLGSRETDLVVRLVREAGPRRGLYGAKITGGGSGGTVAILARADAADAVDRIARTYTRRTGIDPHLFTGSSPGAVAFDHMVIAYR